MFYDLVENLIELTFFFYLFHFVNFTNKIKLNLYNCFQNLKIKNSNLD